MINLYHLIPPENIRKPNVFWYSQGVWNGNIGQKWVIIIIAIVIIIIIIIIIISSLWSSSSKLLQYIMAFKESKLTQFVTIFTFISFISMLRSSHRSCSIKKVFLKISQNSQKNVCQSIFFDKVAGLSCNLLKKTL